MSDFGTLSSGAIACHEFYLSLVKAGFTEEQALYLTNTMLYAAFSMPSK